MLDAKEIKVRLSGGWGGAILALSPDLLSAVEKRGKHTSCPIHGGKDGFRVFKDFELTGGGICNTCGEFADGFSLLQWANDWSFKQAIQAVNEYLGESSSVTSTTTRKPLTQSKPKPNINNQRNIDNVISQTRRINWPMVKYLQNRGLTALSGNIPSDLKAVDSLPYWEDGILTENYPAMIGLVKNLKGEVVTIHRTYLTTEGKKAGVSSPKKLMSAPLQGATSGCAIQLDKPTDKLAITEGIETALAVHLATGLPVWAATSTTLLERVKIPPSVKEVYIMADKDRSGAGERSANVLAQRLAQHHIVKVVLPEPPIPDGEKSVDWLDVYQLETGANQSSLLSSEVA